MVGAMQGAREESGGDAAWYFTPSGANAIGPVGIDEVRAAVLDGRIAPDTAVWNPSYGQEWRAAGLVAELAGTWREMERRRVAGIAATAAIGTNPPRQAFAESARLVAAYLLHPFSIGAWLSLALCNLMAASRMVVGSGDGPVAWLATTSDGMSSPGAFAAAIFRYLRSCANEMFDPQMRVSWLAPALVYGIFTAYICARGHMLLAGKAIFPEEGLGDLWRRGAGRISTLVRLYFSLDLILNFGFFLLVRQFLDAGGMLRGDLAPADLKAALGNGAALRWLVGAALLVGASEFARAFAFHFAEPLVFLWGIPVSTALRLSAGAALRQPVRFAAFFTIVIASRAAYLAIAVFAALMLPPAAMLPAAVIILLPFDFLIRVFGTRFIAPRLPDDADSGN